MSAKGAMRLSQKNPIFRAMAEGTAQVVFQKRSKLARILNTTGDSIRELGAASAPESSNGSIVLWFQRVAATQASNFSAGVWYCKVFLGRSLS